MAKPSNKGVLATQDKDAVNTEAPVVSNPDTNGTTYALVKPWQPSQVQSEGLRKLHALMNTDANPMSLSDVMDKILGNAVVTAYDSKVAARHKTAYKYQRPSMTEERWLDEQMNRETRKFHKELVATRIK